MSKSAKTGRYTELKKMLKARRSELQTQLLGKMRDARANGAGGKQSWVCDDIEKSGIGIQDDIDLSLIQMASENLNKIKVALVRLEQGQYGNCTECGGEIAEKRLRALPFAVRCKDCEEVREMAEQHERLEVARRGVFGLLFT